MPMKIPDLSNLREAVKAIINQNTELGYTPTRFIGVVSVKDSSLSGICSNLLSSPKAIEAMEKAVQKYPELLTLEDILTMTTDVSDWGFDEDDIQRAKSTSVYFDRLVGYQRWIP